MNTTEMVATLRLNGLIPDNSGDYTAAVLLRELNDALRTKFERLVTDARCGYWLQRVVYTTVPNVGVIRMPFRACGLSKIEIGDNSTAASSTFRRLAEVSEGHADLYSVPESTVGTPQVWVARGDKIVLLPTPNAALPIRVSYFVRPSFLIPVQPGGTTAGLITAVNTTARTIVVSSLPSFFDNAGNSGPFVSGTSYAIDVVSPNGWHELQLVSEPASLTTLTFTCTGTGDMSSIQAGDYVRFADQAEWPPIPDDFHRTIIDIATVKVLIQQDYQQKAAGYAQDASSDLVRFSAMISNRVQEEPQRPRGELPSLRRRW